MLGRELLKSDIEKEEFLGGADSRGTFRAAARPWPIEDPTRSLKRLGFLFGMPRLEEVAPAGLEEDQFRPKMSPTMEGEGFGRPDRAAAAGWWVQEGLVAGEAFQDEA